MRISEEAASGAAGIGAALNKAVPTTIGLTTLLGVPWELWIQALTVLWLLLLIGGFLWDRFFEAWAGKPIRAWMWARWLRLWRR